MRLPVAPQPCQYLSVLGFDHSNGCVVVFVLICISLMTHHVEGGINFLKIISISKVTRLSLPQEK